MSAKGMIALMGSGELTATMVEVHKELMRLSAAAGPAVFLDTPAGFQLNADQISEKAVAYFRTRVGHPMAVASYKARPSDASLEAESAFPSLKQAGYILIGPGSPTYAVRQWEDSPIPGILAARVAAGGCLVAASAAALTVGRFTLPVYEIYKVGEELRWEKGIDILGRFGLNLVVVPHWNNAEGGTHDTRRCFMGEPRFRELEKRLPADVTVIGLDEHTACLLDFEAHRAEVRGIGSVVIRRRGVESVFEAGKRMDLGVFVQGPTVKESSPTEPEAASPPVAAATAGAFWETIHTLSLRFQGGIARRASADATQALLELDRLIWHAARDLESEEFISQAREILREWIVQMGTAMAPGVSATAACMAPLVEELITLRDHLRAEQRWVEADMLRDCLQRAGIRVEDTGGGSRWRVDE
jgi:cyanophycinase-like exopeptidase